MVAPTNYDQTNDWLAQVSQLAADLVAILKGGIDVGQSGTLGNLSLIDTLSTAPVGDASALRNAIGLGTAYTRENAVGTVKDTNGFPSGAAFESGSNSNGFYLKTMDGTLLCTNRVKLTYTTSTILQAVCVFPSIFSIEPNIQLTPLDIASPFAPGATYPTPTDRPNVVVRNVSKTESTVRITDSSGLFQQESVAFLYYTAWGRWK